ncbi:DsrE family protein [Candidatus Micrarchaeota archaeon]|nr:DsrE family protein [Candidatus Micrarchaeota archaeon]MBI5177116.1 DsrE family protein [Candidatus Micrarchaeota archaeon]
MKLGIILNTSEPEAAWNAFRLGMAALREGNGASVFLLGKGVECEASKDWNFNVQAELTSFKENGGRLLACGTCLHLRKQKTRVCAVSSMDELLALVSESDKVVSFG